MSAEPVIVLMGSNIEPRRHLAAAVVRLAAHFAIAGVSRVFVSPAVGAEGPDFFNAAVRVSTEREPCDIHFSVLRAIESELGRRRGADPNAPRTIDLDLVVYGALDATVECGAEGGAVRRLRLPDPDVGRHAHATVPLADLVPGYRVGAHGGRTIAELAVVLATPAIRPAGVLELGTGPESG